jgi:UDP-N-acetyl-D-mannosaminuronic acid dehydrogenase
MAKVVENAYRDVNIAFANEVALLCESMGVNVFEVRELINARHDRNMHLPGAGVGGHCLPKDSWLLQFGVNRYGQDPPEMKLIPLAREINDGMPAHMLSLIEEELQKDGIELAKARVAILGVSYLENADDTRNTPAASLAKLLLDRGADVVAHDPHVRKADWDRSFDGESTVPLTADLGQALAGANCAAIATRHREYLTLAPEWLRSVMRTPVVVDGRNALVAPGEGIGVRTIGVG